MTVTDRSTSQPVLTRISDFRLVGHLPLAKFTELATLFGGDAGFPHQALDMH
ncbi:hypothetical protein [Mesorhizobium sp.]|uniref:hypothetical protein n=1 Tax=Mesorhizobium sp. TaxID=1871066 RepID=UPI00257B9C7C|nr:hypothetical protein [Mesorhizobium sp.]